MMEISEIKQLVVTANDWANSASSMCGENDSAASISAQISIAKSLAAIAAVMTEVTGEAKGGRKYIRTYDNSPSNTI